MLKGFYNDININKCSKVIQYLRESSQLSAIRRPTDFKKGGTKGYMGTCSTEKENFHLDLTKKIESMTRSGFCYKLEQVGSCF